MMKDKKFMSCAGHAIWVGETGEGDLIYMVAKGDGTDEYFADWKDAMEYCYQHPRKKH